MQIGANLFLYQPVKPSPRFGQESPESAASQKVEASLKENAAPEGKPSALPHEGKAKKALEQLHADLVALDEEAAQKKALEHLAGASKILDRTYFEVKGIPYTGRFILNLIDEMARERPLKPPVWNRLWFSMCIPVLGWLMYPYILVRDRNLKYHPKKSEGVYRGSLMQAFPQRYLEKLNLALDDLQNGGLIDIEQHAIGPDKLSDSFTRYQFVVLTPLVRKALSSGGFFEKV